MASKQEQEKLNKLMSAGWSWHGYVFSDANNIENIIEAESPTKEMLGEFKQLGKVVFPNATSLGYDAFRLCESITSVSLPNCQSLQGSAFSECTSLESVDLPACVSIGGGVFSDCVSLKNINIPNCESIDSSAFSGAGIEEITCASLKSTGSGAFSNTQYLKRVVFMYPVKLSMGAFGGSAIEAVVMCNRESVAEINSYAFSGTESNYYIYVPAALKAQYEANAAGTDFVSRFRAIEDYPKICSVT